MGFTFINIRDYVNRNAKIFTYKDVRNAPTKQGIYFMFEKDQFDKDGNLRIVRIGKTGNLQGRLINHFEGKIKNSSFRKHVANAIQSIEEKEVSNHIQENISYALVCIPKVLSCDKLESSLIAMLASHSKDLTITKWCGLESKNKTIQTYKIWNYQGCSNKNHNNIVELEDYLQDLLEIGLIKK